MDLNDDTIVINNTEADKEVFLHNGKPSIVINNFVVRNTQVIKSFDNWVADDWTGLFDASEQWGYADSNTSQVSYGATALQVKNKEMGIFLNTFSHNLVTSNTATSIQYVVGWEGNENLGADIWNTKPNDDLCVVAQLDLHHSFVSDDNSDGIAAVNQALITYIFRVKNSTKSFFYNIELHDSRDKWQAIDTIMGIDGQDTNLPIVFTGAHTNNVNTRYSRSIPDFGMKLQEFTAHNLPSGTQVYGSCISRVHMQNIINDIKAVRNDFNISAFTIENLRLDTVIIGPEINTNPTKTYNSDGTVSNPGYRENGNMGMNLHELTVYRLGNSTSHENVIPKSPIDIKVSNKTSNSVTISWKDISNNELGFKIYEGSKLIKTLPSNTTSFHLENLEANTDYVFLVVAFNDKGNSVRPQLTLVKTLDNYAWFIPIYHLINN